MLSKMMMSASSARAAVRAYHVAPAVAAPQLTYDTINDTLKKAEYAVRGKLVLRSMELDKELTAGKTLEFGDSIIGCNIGNPQALKQKALTFPRQVLSIMAYPALLERPEARAIFPEDVIARARRYIAGAPGGIGAYSESKGVRVFREDVKAFIEARDGFEANIDNIFLSDGASPAVQMVIYALLRNSSDALMIPIPQYPLYSASIAMNGGSQVGYYLNEATGWGLDMQALETAYASARKAGKNPRGLVIINPGNPTGGTLSRSDMVNVLQFAVDKNLVLMADEVYQENLWRREQLPFHSFKKVASEMELVQSNKVQLASFHSVSKGFLGECGLRGGYVEFCGFDSRVMDEFYKAVSVSLCPNLAALMTAPPKVGDASYQLYNAEKQDILSSLQRRAVKLAAAFNKLEGVSCADVQGAMYLFPSIKLSQKAQEKAKAAGMQPDMYYCSQLLEKTGIVVVPGSGFGQVDGTWHFRTTILPPENQVDQVLTRFSQFHNKFVADHK